MPNFAYLIEKPYWPISVPNFAQLCFFIASFENLSTLSNFVNFVQLCILHTPVMLEHIGSKQLFRLEFLKTYDNICKITTEKNKWHRRKTIRIPDGRAAGLAYQLLPLKAQILIQMLVGCVKLYLILTKKKLISSFLDGRNDFTYT